MNKKQKNRKEKSLRGFSYEREEGGREKEREERERIVQSLSSHRGISDFQPQNAWHGTEEMRKACRIAQLQRKAKTFKGEIKDQGDLLGHQKKLETELQSSKTTLVLRFMSY